jgi:hypothetical protein
VTKDLLTIVLNFSSLQTVNEKLIMINDWDLE